MAQRASWLPWSALLLAIFVFVDVLLLTRWGYGGDWSPLWVAGQLAHGDPSRVYDFALVSKLQVPVIGDIGLRPYLYPPTTLTLLALLSFLPFWLSFVSVSAAGLVSLGSVARGEGSDRFLLLLAPPVVFAAINGQLTLAVAALAALGLAKLKSKEVLAGVLLALAATLKPTLLILAPVGLLAGRHWRAAGSAAGTACVLAAASVLLFGLSTWFEWLDALGAYREIFEHSAPLYRNAVTPCALALRLGASDGWVTWASLAIAVIGAVTIFIRTDDWRVRMTAVVGGSLIASPYAMNYELAALAPVVLTMRREKIYDLILPVVWALCLFFNASLLGLASIYVWALTSALMKSATDDRGVERGVDVAAGEDDDRCLADGRLAA